MRNSLILKKLCYICIYVCVLYIRHRQDLSFIKISLIISSYENS